MNHQESLHLKTPALRVLLVTMDTHLNSAVKRSIESLKKIAPSISLKIYSATEYTKDPRVLDKLKQDIHQSEIIYY